MSWAFVSLTDNARTGTTPNPLTVSVTYSGGERVWIWTRWATDTADPSISDGTNTYTRLGSTLVDAFTSGRYALFECKNATAGSFTISESSASGNFMTACVAIYSGLDTSVSGIISSNAQQGPGTGTDALTSTTLTPGSQPGVLVGFSYDDSNASAISAGTGFTSRGTMATQDAAFGTASRIEDKNITSTAAVAATFTAAGGGDNFVAFAVFAPESSGGGGGATIIGQACL